jgi:thymidylate kinase
MANLIILEGLSRTGKSTITKVLSEKYGFRNISIKEKMPDYVTNLQDFYHGIHIFSNLIYREFPEETFILDRSFLSELVYSKFFNRPTHQTKSDSVADLLFDNNFVLINVTNTYDKYLERQPKDKIIYSQEDFIKQKDLFCWHFNQYQHHNDSQSWKSRFIELDSSTRSIEQCIESIEQLLKDKNIIK